MRPDPVKRRHALPRLSAARLLLALLAVTWFVGLRPTWLGGQAGYVVVAGTSMEPTLADGTLVVTLPASTYAPGDVVAFAVDVGEGRARPFVIHRVIAGDDATGYVTQGDSRPFRDPWTVSGDDLVGRVAIAVPGLGHALLLLRSPIVLASMAAAFATYLVLGRTPPSRPVKLRQALDIP